MATQKNSTSGRKKPGTSTTKKTSGSRSGSTNNTRGTSGGSSQNRKPGGGRNDNMLLAVFLVLLLVVAVVLVILYFRSRKPVQEEADISPAPTMQVAPGGQEPSDTLQDTDKPEGPEGAAASPSVLPGDVKSPEGAGPGLPAATVPPQEEGDGETIPEASPSPTGAPSPTEEVPGEPEAALSIAEAETVLAAAIKEEGYTFQLSDDHLRMDGRTYYCYVILYQQHEENYAVLVDQQSGELFYYDNSGTKTKFEGAMQYQGNGSPEGMTAEKARSLLLAIEPSAMMLPAGLSECSLSLDEWKTMVNGEECYCLNVFYEGTLAGNIYFDEAAERVYYLDEFGEFVRVR